MPSDPAPKNLSEPPAAVPFELGATPLMARGQSRTTLVRGDRLVSHGMVIAGRVPLRGVKPEARMP